MSTPEKIVRELLSSADITINGKHSWDIQVHDPRFYERALKDGSIGVGESYMDGWWDVEALDEFIARINRAQLEKKIKNLKLFLHILRYRFLNVSTVKRSYIVGEQHYDIGNELYERMLDEGMNYSCGYWKDMDLEKAWKDPENLEKAQRAKLDLICKKLYLKPGMKVLDIGCGWGNFAQYAAKHYNVTVVGLTISKEQALLARERCKGLPVTIRVQDYREMDEKEQFDRVVSVGMFEHVVYKNFQTYMQVVDKCLKQDGLFLLHSIGVKETSFDFDPWTEKYIFPNANIPSLAQIIKSAEGKFIGEDVQNFGAYYYPTLMAWHNNFVRHWKTLLKMNPEKYNERFYRMWVFYLLSSAGGFKARNMQLFQIVFSKSKKLAVYEAVR